MSRGPYHHALRLDEGGTWDTVQPVKPKEDLALEAAMRPFLQDLTVKEREAVAVYFADTLPDLQRAADTLNIDRTTLKERLGRPGGTSRGALRKVREAIMAAVPDEVRRALEDDAPGAYTALRRWLTPAENIREDGTEDPWIVADCLVCHRPCAHWRPNTIMSGGDRYEEPRLMCLIHLN